MRKYKAEVEVEVVEERTAFLELHVVSVGRNNVVLQIKDGDRLTAWVGDSITVRKPVHDDL